MNIPSGKVTYPTLAVLLPSGMQGSCAVTAVEPWVDPVDPWPWLWESLLCEMDSFFFRGRPFRLGAEGKGTMTIRFSHLNGNLYAFENQRVFPPLCCQHLILSKQYILQKYIYIFFLKKGLKTLLSPSMYFLPGNIEGGYDRNIYNQGKGISQAC